MQAGRLKHRSQFFRQKCCRVYRADVFVGDEIACKAAKAVDMSKVRVTGFTLSRLCWEPGRGGGGERFKNKLQRDEVCMGGRHFYPAFSLVFTQGQTLFKPKHTGIHFILPKLRNSNFI